MNKKVLYESIMKNVAKEVKKVLNEGEVIIEPEEMENEPEEMEDQEEMVDDLPEVEHTAEDDVQYLAKIIAFADKFRVLHWAARNMSLHKMLDDFCDEIEDYKDAIAENIQSIIGQFTDEQFAELQIPSCASTEDLLCQLEEVVNIWFESLANKEYEGCKNATSGFLEAIHKYIYLVRLCERKK